MFGPDELNGDKVALLTALDKISAPDRTALDALLDQYGPYINWQPWEAYYQSVEKVILLRDIYNASTDEKYYSRLFNAALNVESLSKPYKAAQRDIASTIASTVLEDAEMIAAAYTYALMNRLCSGFRP